MTFSDKIKSCQTRATLSEYEVPTCEIQKQSITLMTEYQQCRTISINKTILDLIRWTQDLLTKRELYQENKTDKYCIVNKSLYPSH